MEGGKGQINPSSNQEASVAGQKNVFLVACNSNADACTARCKSSSTLENNKIWGYEFSRIKVPYCWYLTNRAQTVKLLYPENHIGFWHAAGSKSSCSTIGHTWLKLSDVSNGSRELKFAFANEIPMISWLLWSFLRERNGQNLGQEPDSLIGHLHYLSIAASTCKAKSPTHPNLSR